MSATKVLSRAPFVPLEVTESWDKTLLERASELLRYRPSALQKAEETRVRSINENIFARALDELGIQPFTLSSVQAYKKRMLKEAHRGESWAFTRWMHTANRGDFDGADMVRVVGWPSWVAFAVTSVVGTIVHFGGVDKWGWDGHNSIRMTSYPSWTSVGHVVVYPLCAVAIWSFLMLLRHKSANRVQAQWNTHQVSDSGPNYNDGYKADIPMFAVQRMVSLKEALPEVTFSVEQLSANRESLGTEKRIKPLPPDPFLVANFRGICAYIDVWDEPKFEGRRTA